MMISDDWDVRLAVLGHLLPLDANLKVSVQRLPLQWWLTLRGCAKISKLR
jgi:hypothetical protein